MTATLHTIDTTDAPAPPSVGALPIPNLPLLRKVLDHITAHPDEWNQRAYVTLANPEHSDCGTRYCIAGHAVVMAYGTVIDHHPMFGDLPMPANGMTWETAGRTALGITHNEALELFWGSNSRSSVQVAAERIAARAGERL